MEASDPGRGRVEDTLYITLKEGPALVEDTGDISYFGRIRPDAKATWMTFPGKFPTAWDSLVSEHHGDSVACVFLTQKSDGLGDHSADPLCHGRCFCPRIYGVRDYKAFGYLMTVRPPFTPERLQKLTEKAAVTGAVLVREDATKEERAAAEVKAMAAWEKSGRVAAWGCKWYEVWLEKVREAVRRKQRLKAVFFPGEVGMGKLTMQQLSQESVNPWDNVGIGGSQKCELATVDYFREREGSDWEYDEVDVAHFLRDQFKVECQVDALLTSGNGAEWVRGTIIEVPTVQPGAQDGDLQWKVKCSRTGDNFTTGHVRHVCKAIQNLLDTCGRDYLMSALTDLLPGRIRITGLKDGRLQSGVSALGVTVAISGVIDLHALRDKVLSGDFEVEVNGVLSKKNPAAQVRVDKARFLDTYEHSLLRLVELTQHQRKKLQEVADYNGDTHLSAPAGAGKTFVAVQRVLDVLSAGPSHQVLYVSPTESLALHFLRWTAVQFAGGEEPHLRLGHLLSLLSRMTVLILPFEGFRSPAVNGNRIFLAEPRRDSQTFDLVVIDECQNIFRPGVNRSFLEQHMVARRSLLLSDDSQSSAVSQSFPEMQRVRLTEVVRSTKRIVVGAAAFQLSDGAGPDVTSLGTDGPPLKTFVFESTGPDVFTIYAEHVVRALFHLFESFPSTSFHNRLALLVPDDEFLKSLKPVLSEALKHGAPHRNFRLVSFADSLGCFPAQLLPQCNTLHSKEEDIILDLMGNSSGLEALIVICIGLDSRIVGGASDLATRAQLYRGITRAQLLAVVINEFVRDGWLEFLGTVKFTGKKFIAQSEAAAVRKEAVANLVSEAKKVSDGASVRDAHWFWGWFEACTRCRSGSVSDATADVVVSPREQPSPQEHQTPELPNANQLKVESNVWDTTSNQITAQIHELRFAPLSQEGLFLDFLDDGGIMRTVFAKYRPLGIKHNNVAPVTVHDFTVNSYAKMELGLRPGWKLTRINDEELNDNPDFEEVNERLNHYMRGFPLWPLPLGFRRNLDDTLTSVIKFVERPIGITFANIAPIKIQTVDDDSPAQREGVKVGWFLTQIGDVDVRENHNFREVMRYFREATQALDER